VKVRLNTLEQCRIILHAASWIVPRRLRVEWRREWEAELAYASQISHEKIFTLPQVGLRQRCCGAFLDAAWYRLNQEDLRRSREQWARTPGFALFMLTSVLFLLVTSSGYLPRMRSILMAPPYADSQRMVTVSRTGIVDSRQWVVPYSWVKIWRRNSRAVEGVAAYSASPQAALVAIGGERRNVDSVRVEPGLLQIFGVKPVLGDSFAPAASNCRICLVLTYQAWQGSFAGNSHILQRKATIDGQEAVIVGVLPERFWFPSHDVGVLRWGDENSFSGITPVGVVVRLRPGVTERRAEWELQRSIANGTGEAFSGSSIQVWLLQERVRQPLISYMFALGISLLVMTTVLWSGRLNLLSQRKGIRAVCRWWIFFATKTSLLLVMLLAGVVEFTAEPYIFPKGTVTLILESGSLWIFSVGCVFVLWWSLIDQQERCRACLQRLSLPAEIGSSGCMLLSWAGTELVCAQGHGLLHVTETDVCWLEPAQWTQLDESWEPLFAGNPGA
jgi:hypothetical protein